jgi:hypothetical protein
MLRFLCQGRHAMVALCRLLQLLLELLLEVYQSYQLLFQNVVAFLHLG